MSGLKPPNPNKQRYRDALLKKNRYADEYRKLFAICEAMMHDPESELAINGRKFVQGIIDERDKLKKEKEKKV